MIHSTEERWGRSLRRVITVLPGEGLAGLTLRADHENGLEAGTVQKLSLDFSVGPHIAADRYPAFQYLATSSNLERLAELIDASVDAIRGTTLIDQLQRIYGPEVTARSLGGSASEGLRVCPACIAESRLLTLAHGLPRVSVCRRHRCLLVTHCSCGERLRVFGLGQKPFRCTLPGCGRSWADLDAPSARGEWLEQAAYQTMLAGLLKHADSRIWQAAKAAIAERRWSLPGRERSVWVGSNGVPRALPALAWLLTMAEVPLEDVLSYQEEGPKQRGVCLDNKCAFVGRGEMMRGRSPHSRYCMECGSRYAGGRLVMTFDLGHGHDTVSQRSVARARAKLRGYIERVDHVSRRWPRRGARPSVDEVLDRAGVPTSPNLRARRLGLVWLVRRNLGLPISDDIPPFVKTNTRWQTAPAAVWLTRRHSAYYAKSRDVPSAGKRRRRRPTKRGNGSA